ncbi:hypothetical protein L1987_61832 [Smallanthus sonchifolius]|uniref:Uncharacterized protein n=1 Tax=Smallanthus sonchifolius TaxID=185202 RepID=A0ACB9C8T4_9ASTR|nr:hypothetical protein L1987_61832 [Smallanthus sonchifolius]
MTLSGTLVKQVTIMSDGDVFHEIFRYRPHHISEMSPDKIKDGKSKVAKEVIEAIDEEKKSVCFKMIGAWGRYLGSYE